MIQSLKTIFKRDLDSLKKEVQLFKNESDLWETKPGIINTAGNLVLHICGNLNHYIGATLGSTGYIRERDREFSDKDVPRASLLQNIEDTSKVVITTLSQLSPDDLKKTYPEHIREEKFTIEFFLIHLHGHLQYHKGQVNYLRRIITG